MAFEIVLAIVAVLAGATASLAGFGIGSLLTPLMALETGMGVAVAGVSIAHFAGTGLRFFLMKRSLNRRVLLGFGLTSAAGGLVGALLHSVFQNAVLSIIFGCLLVVAGLFGLTGIAERLRFKGASALVVGAASGLFGGLVGNQGGIRSAALLGFRLDRDQFVATATVIALMVDAARLPVYVMLQSAEIASVWPLVLIATIGVLVGTVSGKRILERLPESVFKKTVAGIILLIGVLVLVRS